MVAVVVPDEEESYLLAILDSPDGLDLAEFSWFDPEAEDGCYRAWDFQWPWYTDNTMFQVDQGGRALGKALALDTPVPTPSGWTTMGEIKDGDVVFDDCGLATRVLYAHPVRTGRRCFEITFSDGTQIVADEDHLWETWSRRERKAAQRAGDDWGRGPSVRSTIEISRSMRDGGEINHAVEVGGPVRLSTARLPVDPYEFGRQVADEQGRIPPTYLRASLRQRKELLHGLYDAAGSIDTNMYVEFHMRTPEIAEGIGELLCTLGEQPHFSLRTLNSGEKRYRVHYRPLRNPAPRSIDKFTEPTIAKSKITQRRIMEVREVESVPTRCLTVDSPTHLFLVSRAFIPTHNTVGIKMRAFAFPFYYEGQRMLITAPELNHLRPLTDEIEKALLTTRLMKEMLPDGKGAGIARQPHWQVRFRNGAALISRLPNRDGKGVKGQHVINIEMDEAQDYPLPGWIEIVETLNAGLPGAMWRCHGVSKGVRDKFFEKTQPDSGWKVHRPMAMHRPGWGAAQRDAKMKEYGGSRQAIDYRRNIYGEHGDASNSVFVLARLMNCVDIDEGSIYNQDVYTKVMLEFEHFPAAASDGERLALIHAWIDIPGTHKNGYSQKVGGKEVGAPKGYTSYWAGMDVGVTNHPSELLVFGQRTGTDFLELLLRIQMHRINTDDQMAVVTRVMDLYGDRIRLGIDKTGVGFPIWDQLTRMSYGERVYGFGFSEKRVVAIEDRPMVGNETIKDLARYRNFVEASTDWLRNDYVDAKRLRLPYDREVLIEFQGQTYTVIRDSGDPYGTKRLFAGGSFHTLDAAKIAVGAKHIPPLEDLLESKPAQESVLDMFAGM